MNIRRTWLLVIAMLNVGLITSGCGKGQSQSLVKGVTLDSHMVENDLYVKMSSQLNTGATQMMGFDLQVADPKYPGEIFGTIGLHQAFSGSAEIVLDVNLSQIVQQLNYGINLDSSLPNGTPIPVGGLTAPVIAVPIGNSAKVYASYGNGTAMIGVAVVIKEFDSLGGYIGGVNIFPMFDFGKGVRGIGGIFAGTQGRQSGIALFVDASTAVQGAQAPLLAKSALIEKSAVPMGKVIFMAPAASQSQKDAANSVLYKLHRKRAKLHSL